MRVWIIISLVAILTACNNSSLPGQANGDKKDKDQVTKKEENANPAAGEDELLKDLLDLDEVKKADAHIRQQTGGKTGISIMKESDTNGESFIRAGFNGKERFETYFQFYINTRNKTIRIYDPVSDRKMTMEEYRKQSGQ